MPRPCAGAFRLKAKLSPLRRRPLPLAEDRLARAVRADAVDVNLARADHPVHVDEARIAAGRRNLLRAHIREVGEALGIALAERDVARGIFVEEGVVEQ